MVGNPDFFAQPSGFDDVGNATTFALKLPFEEAIHEHTHPTIHRKIGVDLGGNTHQIAAIFIVCVWGIFEKHDIRAVLIRLVNPPTGDF